MDKIDTLNFQGVSLDVYGTPNEPLFLAVDVAEIIEYSEGHTSHMLDSVSDDEKFLLSTRSKSATARGSASKKWFLTEEGLYEVLMQSRKPIARKFKSVIKRMLVDVRRKEGHSIGQWFGKFESVEDLDGFNDLRADFGLPTVTDEEAFGKMKERWYEYELASE